MVRKSVDFARKWLKISGCALLTAVLLAGCGSEGGNQEQGGQDRNPQNQEYDPQDKNQQNQEHNSQDRNQQNQEQEETLSVSCCYVSMDRRNLLLDGITGEETGQLLNMQCLAAEKGVYVSGTRRKSDAAEMAIYRLNQEGQPELAASYPDERLLAWCESSDGIAFISVHSDKSEDEVYRSFFLRVLESRDGEAPMAAEEWPLTELFQEKGISVGNNGVMAMGEDMLILTSSNADELIVVPFSSETEMVTVPVREGVEAIRYINEECVHVLTRTGTLYAVSLHTGNQEILAQNLFGQIRGQGFCTIGEDCIYAGNTGGLYAVALSDGQAKKLADHTFSSEDAGSLWMDETAGRGVAVVWSEGTREVYQYFISSAAQGSAETTEREIVILENYRVGDDLKKAVRKFNQSNDQYWIEIVEGSSEDYDIYEERFNAGLAAGEGPDLMIPSESRVRNDIQKGIFENLMPYIQRDLETDDYIQSALYAFRQDDFIYALGSSFALSVMVTEREWADSAGSMSLWDVFPMTEQSGMPVFMTGLDSSRLLYWCLSKSGSGIFDMDKVRACILFAESYWDDTKKHTAGGAVGKDAVAVTEIVRNPLDIADIERFYGRGMKEAVITGIPLDEGSSFLFDFNSFSPLGINAASGHKEGAWAFIKFLLGEEYQFSLNNQFDGASLFPVRKDAFEAVLEQYGKPKSYDVYIEEIGEIITITTKYSLNRCLQTMHDYETEAATEEQIELLRKIVEQSRVVIREEFEAELIVGEEAGSYFEGGKTLEQVMEVIEKRLEIYREERQ